MKARRGQTWKHIGVDSMHTPPLALFSPTTQGIGIPKYVFPDLQQKEPSSTRAWLPSIIFRPLIISAARLECD